MDATTEPDRLAQLYMRSRLSTGHALGRAGEDLRPLTAFWGPTQALRSTFDYLPRESAEDWDRIGQLLDQVPAALVALRSTFEAGVAEGLMAARRQALGAAADCEKWSDPAAGFFASMVAGAPSDLLPSARRAAAAYGELGEFLTKDYAPRAATRDAVGEETYQLWANDYLGGPVDLDDAYAWGWEELNRCLAVERSVCGEIEPGSSLAGARAVLRDDSAGWMEGIENLRTWMQELLDRAVADLDGIHFEIPDAIRQIDVVLSTPDRHPSACYAAPSEDFSRPGRVWWPDYGVGVFRPQALASVAYHEGVPGHHLQTGLTHVRVAELSRFQRAFDLNFHGEGWALYAEALMGELGFLETPEARLAMVSGQTARALRVVLDIGMHLELAVPPGAPWHGGETMTPEVAHSILVACGDRPGNASASIYRYLGGPGQAITYTLGQRAWRQARTAAEAAGFSLKDFHSVALALGPLGVDDLGREVARVLAGATS